MNIKRKEVNLINMLSKIMLVMFIVLASYVNSNIKAVSDNITINGSPYGSLQLAINAAQNNETIMINADIEENDIINANTGNNFSIDLKGNTIDSAKVIKITDSTILEIKDTSSEANGKLISADDPMFRIEGGKLTLTSGTYHSNYNGSWAWGVLLVGSSNSAAENYSVVDVKKDATISFEINGYGIATSPTSSKDKEFGMIANIDGNIIADGSEAGSSVYINGNQKSLVGQVTKINISKTAVLQGTAYAAGYGIWNISGGDFQGSEALSIKAGEFNISDGNFLATGDYYDPAATNNNGSEDTGATISMTSNDNYAGKIIMNISGGTFESTYGHALYEGISVKNEIPAATKTHVKELNISEGTFIGADFSEKPTNSNSVSTKVLPENKDAIEVSEYENSFISGGTFNTRPKDKYFVEGYRIIQLANGLYSVVEIEKCTIKYYGNGNTSGSVPIDSTKYVCNVDNATIKGKNTLVKKGYNFVKWNTKSNGKGTSYKKGDIISPIKKNLKLYAIWNKEETIKSELPKTGADLSVVLLASFVSILGVMSYLAIKIKD